MSPDAAVSLLWPPGVTCEHPVCNQPQRFVYDLALGNILDAFDIDPRFRAHAEAVLYNPCTDVNVIDYRLAVCSDFLSSTQLAAGLEGVSQQINSLSRHLQNRHTKDTHPFEKIAWRLEVLNLYMSCMHSLYTTLHEVRYSLQSSGLQNLHDVVQDMVNGDEFKALAAEIPALKAAVDDVSSVTVGINLDENMRPVEATFLAVSRQPFKPQPLLSRLLGQPSGPTGVLSPIHSIMRGRSSPTPLQIALFKDLEGVYREALQHVDKTLARFTTTKTRLLLALQPEIHFYIGVTHMVNRLRKACMPVCRPVVLPVGERQCTIKNTYDVTLALGLLERMLDLREVVVTNDVVFNDAGRIFILTGPNQGGKTTFTRGVGIAQVMLQAGMYVPGTEAHMSPVDAVYTHFLEEEKQNVQEGRLGEESRRLSEIFGKATRHSLVLLNESLSSTSPGESLYLTQDIVRGLRMLGTRAIFATHLHDLAAKADVINTSVQGDSCVVSLVAGLMKEAEANTGSPTKARRTYKVMVAPPQGESFARDIATQYGISFAQIATQIASRIGKSPPSDETHKAG